MKKTTNLSTQKIAFTVMKWGTQIVFLISIVILSYMSFVEDFSIKPNLKNVTILAAVAAVLNWLVWDSWYNNIYEKTMMTDRNNEEYSVCRRYYAARRNWKYNDLQQCIRTYNKNFVAQWKADVEDITGRTIADIKEKPLKHCDHKWLCYKVKHHKYPKSGIRTPKDMLNVLSVNASDTKKVNVHKAEHYHSAHQVKKIISSTLSMIFAASITINFIQEGWQEALFTLLFTVACLCMSLFFGATSGAKGAQIKLATAEEICELLEEWKGTPPSEEPFNYSDNNAAEKTKEVIMVNDHSNHENIESFIELT